MSDHSEDIYVEMTHLKRPILIFPFNQLVSGGVRDRHMRYLVSFFLPRLSAP